MLVCLLSVCTEVSIPVCTIDVYTSIVCSDSEFDVSITWLDAGVMELDGVSTWVGVDTCGTEEAVGEPDSSIVALVEILVPKVGAASTHKMLDIRHQSVVVTQLYCMLIDCWILTAFTEKMSDRAVKFCLRSGLLIN